MNSSRGWTDAHCHLQDHFLSSRDDESSLDGESALTGVLERARRAGVDRAVVVGTDLESSREALTLSEFAGPLELFATVGLHPHDATNDLSPLRELARERHPRLVGIGECGLDYYYEHSPRDAQRRVFADQIGLAHELNLALVVHARDAFDDLFSVFATEGVPARTVIHCFTGTPSDVEGCLARGCDISLSGIVTFKNADLLREAARLVPLSRLHVETDSPFLAPVPHRGRTNEPAYVTVVGEFLSGLREEPLETLRAATVANTARLFAFSA